MDILLGLIVAVRVLNVNDKTGLGSALEGFFDLSQAGRDLDLVETASMQRPTCPVEWLDSEDPLFLLYTSGSTGKIQTPDKLNMRLFIVHFQHSNP